MRRISGASTEGLLCAAQGILRKTTRSIVRIVRKNCKRATTKLWDNKCFPFVTHRLLNRLQPPACNLARKEKSWSLTLLSGSAPALCDVTEGTTNQGCGGVTPSTWCSCRPRRPAPRQHKEHTSVSKQEAEILAGGHKHMANCGVFLEICTQLKHLHARCATEKQRGENVKIRKGGHL